MKDATNVKAFNTQIEAELAKGLLESNGIAAFVIVNDESGAYPYPMSLVTGVKLFVSAKDLKSAQAILKKVK